MPPNPPAATPPRTSPGSPAATPPRTSPDLPAATPPRTSPDLPAGDPRGPALTLYQRDDCHLCDLALEALAAARAPGFESVFIDGDAELEARYGDRVPVLRDECEGRELEWPFDVAALARFLA